MELFDKFFKQLDSVKILESYKISIGLQTEDEGKFLPVKVVSEDDTTTEIEMSLKDIMYVAELGTATLPATYILEILSGKILEAFTKESEEPIGQLMAGHWNRAEVTQWMLQFETKANQIIADELQKYLNEQNFIAMKQGQEVNSNYYGDLGMLKKYIKCKIFRK